MSISRWNEARIARRAPSRISEGSEMRFSLAFRNSRMPDSKIRSSEPIVWRLFAALW